MSVIFLMLLQSSFKRKYLLVTDHSVQHTSIRFDISIKYFIHNVLFPKVTIYSIYMTCPSNFRIEQSFNVSITKINSPPRKSNVNRLDNDDDGGGNDDGDDVIDGNTLRITSA